MARPAAGESEDGVVPWLRHRHTEASLGARGQEAKLSRDQLFKLFSKIAP
jgi:hypothetical protein